jgi:hypothetical protein
MSDPKMDAKMDGNHDRRMSDLRLGVKNLDVMDDRTMDANHDLRMNDLLGDPKMGAMMDVSRGHHRNDLRLDVKILDVNLNCHRVIRKCALRALSLGAKKTGGLKKNCDQLSRDHLQCDHRMLRHRGKNLNLDVKNLGVKLTSDPQCYDLTHLRHVRMNHHGNPMKVDQRMGAKDASRMRNYGHLDDPVNGTMIYLQAWLLLFFITWGK